MENEPVTLQAVLGGAVNATLGLLALIFDWPAETTAALLLASASWIGVLAYFARSKVVPVVKLEKLQEELN